jgi:hypothetical protein
MNGFILDAAEVHSEHELTIKCDTKQGSVKRSIDLDDFRPIINIDLTVLTRYLSYTIVYQDTNVVHA